MILRYSCVIATRNRPEALRLSLPLLLAQSRLPEKIVVIDSSDDPSQNRTTIDSLASSTSVKLYHEISAKGASLQRNIGLQHVDSEIVFFPDDDSLFYPDVAERIMKIYEADSQRRIGGVCGAETNVRPGAPVAVPSDVRSRKSAKDRLRSFVAPYRRRLEDGLAPDPMKLAAHKLQKKLPPIEPWLAGHNASWVEWMTGFRMSFRTDVIRAVQFNEQLGTYSLYEDVDAGLNVLAKGYSLVCAADAKIFHDKSPERRSDGRQMGVMNILNRAYVTLRAVGQDAEILRAVKGYAAFRTLQFAAMPLTAFGRDRLFGAVSATRAAKKLAKVPAQELDKAYAELRRDCVKSGSGLS